MKGIQAEDLAMPGFTKKMIDAGDRAIFALDGPDRPPQEEPA